VVWPSILTHKLPSFKQTTTTSIRRLLLSITVASQKIVS
jgi:hypothetical protein